MRLSTQYPSPRGVYERLEARSSLTPNFTLSVPERAALTVFGGDLHIGDGTVQYDTNTATFQIDDSFRVMNATNNWVRFETGSTQLGEGSDDYLNTTISLSSVLRITSGTMFVMERAPSSGDNVEYWVETEMEYSAPIDGTRLMLRTMTQSGTNGQVYINCNRSGEENIFQVSNAGVNRFSVSSTGRVYVNTGLVHGDIAEPLPAEEMLPAGSVAIIGEDGRVSLTDTPYDTRVAGVVTTRPAVILANNKGSEDPCSFLALRGTVPCLAETSRKEIRAGDMLVTSSVPGHAMAPEKTVTGAYVGKALQSMEKGKRGYIMVLIR